MDEIKYAEIECLWIAEDKPDTFSGLIQWFFNTPYSHCAIKVMSTGMIWHATTPGGVCEQAPADVMVGCHVAASRMLTLKCTDAELLAYLETERNKPYGHRGNIGLVIDKMFLRPVIRLITPLFRPHADAERNCSEFVGCIVHKFFKPLKGSRDKWTPPCLEKFLVPRRYV